MGREMAGGLYCRRKCAMLPAAPIPQPIAWHAGVISPMTASRCVALIFDPHRLDRPQGLLLAGVHRYASRGGGWRCVFDLGAARHLDGHYDGAIAAIGDHVARRSARAGVPAVFATWHAFAGHPIPRAVENRWASARLAAEHLHRRGYRAFAHVGIAQHAASRVERDHFGRWLRRHGLSFTDHRLSRRRAVTATRWADGLGRLTRWLAGLEPPVGVFCTTDALARAVADAAARKGLRVPQDVGLVGGGNNVPLCELEEPTLTSFEYHYETVGYRAAELLDRLMGGEPPPRRNVLIPPTLVPRASTDRRGVGDPCVARALDHIAAHLAEPIRAPDVAAASGLSQRQLERRMRDARGRTIVQEILGARLAEARHLLTTTDLSIAAIAAQAGFASRRALSAAFRREFSATPTAYRAHRPG